MAVTLKDVQHTQQSILARFQQRLGDPPSPLDILIINQIGCMLISSLVSAWFIYFDSHFSKKNKSLFRMIHLVP
jgi:hypothetical protein